MQRLILALRYRTCQCPHVQTTSIGLAVPDWSWVRWASYLLFHDYSIVSTLLFSKLNRKLGTPHWSYLPDLLNIINNITDLQYTTRTQPLSTHKFLSNYISKICSEPLLRNLFLFWLACVFCLCCTMFFLFTIFVVYHLVMALWPCRTISTSVSEHYLYCNEYPKVIYIGFYFTKGNRLTQHYDQWGLLTREQLVKLQFHDHIYMVLKTLN